VIDTATVVEREVRDRTAAGSRCGPAYTTTDNQIDGAVITLADINALKANVEHAETIVDNVPVPLVLPRRGAARHVGSRSSMNVPSSRRGDPRPLRHELGKGRWSLPGLRRSLTEVLREERRFHEFEVETIYARRSQDDALETRARCSGAEGGA